MLGRNVRGPRRWWGTRGNRKETQPCGFRLGPHLGTSAKARGQVGDTLITYLGGWRNTRT